MRWVIGFVLIVVVAGVVHWFLRPPGQIVVQTMPAGVQVAVDGRVVGTTPDTGLVVSGLGAYFLEFSRSGYETATATVYLQSGQVVVCEFAMQVEGMVLIRGGTFEMGWDAGPYNEKPGHPVRLSSFYIDQTEVTVSDFQKFKPDYRPSFRGHNKPATNIAWHEARDYCVWAKNKRLPTEAEWERACRGSEGRAYEYGNTYDVLLAHTEKKLDAGPVVVERTGNLWGMTGNVWEWCSDWYDRDYYRKSVTNNPRGPDRGTQRVLRGGGWYSNAQAARCTHRAGNVKKMRDPSFGFRCVRDLV